MTLVELNLIIRRGESERLEFKRTTGERKEGMQTVCAMLNGLGGYVLFGVGNNGQTQGQQITAKTLEDIASEICKIEPPAFPEILSIEVISGLVVLVIRVSGGSGLYTFDGRPYIRIGSSTSVMPKAEYEKRIISYLHTTHRWENGIAEGVNLKDLDYEQIHITFEEAIRLGRLEVKRSRDISAILRGFEVMRDGKLLNAAVALFGKSESLRIMYPQLGIRLARFRGGDRLADFLDNRQYWGHAFDLLQHAESFLLDHVTIAGRIVSGKMRREDFPSYPPRATREAIANAICHRDYTMAGGAVAIAYYDDHLEIVNPGSLHFGLTPQKLLKPHESKPWNPIIANVLHSSGVIERWGSGTLNIVDWCLGNGNPSPTWKEQAGSVYVVFNPSENPAISPHVTGQVTGQVTGHVTGHVTGQVETWITTVLQALIEQDLSRSELQAIVGIHHRETFQRNYLDHLINQNYVKRTIPEKPKSRLQKYRITPIGIAAIH